VGIKLAIAAGVAALSAPGAALVAVAAVTAPTASMTACDTGMAGSAQTAEPTTSDAARGGVGTGLRLGVLPVVHAAAMTPYVGKVRMAVANLPTTHRGAGSLPTVPGSLRAMTRAHPDFIALNEVTDANSRFLSGHAPGYDAYKDPMSATRHGNSRNSLENAVMWDAHRWSLVDAGRFEYVKDDLVVFKGRPVDWNRYATWTILRNRANGRQIVVIATHNMTNPQKQRRTHGDYAWPSRIAQYAAGMRLLRQLVAQLSAYGPVLLAGDMNVHPSQGAWSAPDQLAQAGYSFTYDHAVIYQFFPRTARVLGTSLVPVSSDHPHALETTLLLRSAPTAAPVQAGPETLPDSLTATDTNGRAVTLDHRQLARAATIIAVGRSEGVPARGELIALMAALTESSLRVLSNTSAYPESGSISNDGNGGDHDSLGLFQQRPTAGWGTVRNLMDPVWSSRAFFGGRSGPNHGSPRGLLDVAGWQTMDPGAAAQAVQGSAHPGRYAVNEPVAEKILAALSGASLSSGLGCAQPDGSALPANLPHGFPGAFIAAAAKEIGTPYVWGGGNFDGPTNGGFDCSGLVLYAAYQASGGRLRLPHYTGAQIHLGQPVAWDDKKPGDLIFFSYPGAGAPHHVAIYVGDNRILQAPHSGDHVRYGTIGEFSGEDMAVRRLG